MRMRYNANAQNELEGSSHYVTEFTPDGKKEICLEIGMGKGKFIIENAFLNPDKIYIGVEICKSVLALAIKKIARFEQEKGITLNNLFLMSFDAIEIERIIPEYSVDMLYLNFSDPWPKKKHEKRRITHTTFLEKYHKIVKQGGILQFKTDNRLLFEYSVVSISNSSFLLKEVYLDLHQTKKENVLTEYEMKFCEKGPIYLLIAQNGKESV